MLFLATPTIVSVLDGNTETTSLFSNMNEEEMVHGKEVLHPKELFSSYEFINLAPYKKGAIISRETLQLNLLETKILIPPPERV